MMTFKKYQTNIQKQNFVLYNKNNKDKNIIKMHAGLKNNRIIGYTIMEYRDYK